MCVIVGHRSLLSCSRRALRLRPQAKHGWIQALDLIDNNLTKDGMGTVSDSRMHDDSVKELEQVLDGRVHEQHEGLSFVMCVRVLCRLSGETCASLASKHYWNGPVCSAFAPLLKNVILKT